MVNFNFKVEDLEESFQQNEISLEILERKRLNSSLKEKNSGLG